jgi:YHS domain-containing protein
MQSKLILCLLGFAIFACNQNSRTAGNEKDATRADSMMMKTGSTKIIYTAAMVDNKKDPNCGMPVTAGIEDTVHYKNKVYGFCSKECKDAFLKNPEELVKNADLK